MSLAWMRAHAPGFNELPRADFDEITAFFWLWSFFEGTFLCERASPARFERLVQEWEADGRLTLDPVAASVAYFQARYFRDGEPTDEYFGLRLYEYGEEVQQEVRRFLSGDEMLQVALMTGLLLVIYRLRNNLMHGPKWRYRVANQLENFQHANQVLVRVMEMDGRLNR